jgi:hypothetical protein
MGGYMASAQQPSSKRSQKNIEKPPERKDNPKRKILSDEQWEKMTSKLDEWAQKSNYEGKADHKRYPGDFNLSPPASPRSNKTLCDSDYIIAKIIFTQKKLCSLIKQGILLGMVDNRCFHGWPRHIWVVICDDIVLEAKQSENYIGTYHGYPMLKTDSLYETVIKIWEKRNAKRT